jgi:CheY-like chemotaxis protein
VQGKRVLIVDDSVDTARGMAKILRRAGYDVHAVYDGFSAIEAARTFHPNIVLLDIGLPSMDGYQIAEELRKGAHGSDLVIIAISGYGPDQDPKRSLAAGFDHHLVKPVDFHSLLALLARVTVAEAKLAQNVVGR